MLKGGVMDEINQLAKMIGAGNSIEIRIGKKKVTVATFTFFGGMKEATSVETAETIEAAARACARSL
jgi:hypothetical protein